MIKVGAATETEMKEKKARVEDALHATRAAVEEGIVPGGGVALLRAAKALETLKGEGDEQIGVNIIKRAFEEPLRQIVDNAGYEGAIVVEKVITNAKEQLRLQRRRPRSTRTWSRPASSTRPRSSAPRCRTPLGRGLMLTTEAMVSEIPEKKAPMPMGGGHGGPDMDY